MSAVEEILEEVKKRVSKKTRLFAVFDRDGTLVPILEDPNASQMPGSVRNALYKLAQHSSFYIGILSARGLSQLAIDFPDSNLILAGNYGMEIKVPKGTEFRHPVADAATGLLNQARDRLQRTLLPQYKTILEDHGLSLCLHWHLAPLTFRERISMLVEELSTQTPGLRFKKLPTSYEIWPAVDWDKAHGLDQMLRLSRFSPHDVLFMYCGDSAPDEPAFNWVNQREGISIRIGKSTAEAQYVLETPEKLHQLILGLGHLEVALTGVA